jgi:hypothetical protein
MAAFHKCPVAGCPKMLPNRFLMCGAHWGKVPADVQAEVYSAWRSGAGGGSERHREACAKAIRAAAR